jgi:hypothetical protein
VPGSDTILSDPMSAAEASTIADRAFIDGWHSRQSLWATSVASELVPPTSSFFSAPAPVIESSQTLSETGNAAAKVTVNALHHM